MSRDPLHPRLAAVACINQVLAGRSLSDALPKARESVRDSHQALVQEWCFGVLRWRSVLVWQLSQLLEKPLRREPEIETLLLVALYQLQHMDTPAHRVVNDAVSSAVTLRKKWAKGLINAVLRRYLRESQTLAEHELSPTTQWNLPKWWLRRLQQDWPEHWQDIAQAQLQRAPLTLRVHGDGDDRDVYLEELEALGLDASAHAQLARAIVINTPCPVDRLPGFARGRASVQDASAQLAVEVLTQATASLDADRRHALRVLDACAAPGGKTLHWLQALNPGEMVALDHSAPRLEQVQQNLERAQRSAELLQGDARTSDWWDGQAFDLILADVPCSASGVLRRHPDAKWLRRAEDITALAQTQAEILDTLWPMLKVGGKLVYSTCSVFKEENTQQVQAFLARTPDARCSAVALPWGRAQGEGWQVLPAEQGGDGFYYALLVRN